MMWNCDCVSWLPSALKCSPSTHEDMAIQHQLQKQKLSKISEYV
jgi:hypothetical protein